MIGTDYQKKFRKDPCTHARELCVNAIYENWLTLSVLEVLECKRFGDIYLIGMYVLVSSSHMGVSSCVPRVLWYVFSCLKWKNTAHIGVFFLWAICPPPPPRWGLRLFNGLECHLYHRQFLCFLRQAAVRKGFYFYSELQYFEPNLKYKSLTRF